MMHLKGNPKEILGKIELFNNDPPDWWEKYECKDEYFRNSYFWFKYVGNAFPTCIVYIPKKLLNKQKVWFMFLPENNDDYDKILKNLSNLAHSLFNKILDNNITLEDE